MRFDTFKDVLKRNVKKISNLKVGKSVRWLSLLRVVNSKFWFRKTKSSETRPPRDTSYQTRRNSSTKDEYKSKGKVWGGRDPNSSRISKSSGWTPCPDEEYDTYDICRMCQRQLIGAAVEVIKVWLDN
jgi:hypothetical protein